MTPFNKIPVVFYLTSFFFFGLSLQVKAQEQVVIKGNSTMSTYESLMERKVRNQIAGAIATITANASIFSGMGLEDEVGNIGIVGYNLASGGSQSDTSQDFTITYTQEMMHMVASTNDSTSMTMVLLFNPEGTQLDMKIKVPGQSPMTMRVPHGNTIASSNTQSLLTAAPVSNMEINGFDAGKYNFHTEGDLALNDVIINQQPVKLKKVEEGEVWLAPDAPGIGLMKGFYLNLTLGGYDLAGAEDGGIMALMDRLLERGMLIRAKETTIVSSYGQRNGEFLFKTVTETNISSVIVEPFNEELLSLPDNPQDPSSSSNSQSGSPINPDDSSDSSSGSQTDSGASNSQNDSSNTSDTNNSLSDECDCSCEKYAEFIKLAEKNKKSKKSKKNTDNEMMQALNIKCMQECMMEWTKCMMIKN